LGTGPGLTNIELLPLQVFGLQTIDCGPGLWFIGHFHKPESFCPAGVSVFNFKNLGGFDVPKGFKCLSQIAFGYGICQISNIDIHPDLLLNPGRPAFFPLVSGNPRINDLLVKTPDPADPD
jgi:hypothetical protein